MSHNCRIILTNEIFLGYVMIRVIYKYDLKQIIQFIILQ